MSDWTSGGAPASDIAITESQTQEVTAHNQLRLLPWAGPDGKPCYLSTDDPDGYVSRLADQVEAAQLEMASELLEQALRALDDGASDPEELKLLVAQLASAMRDVLRVATSRGHHPVPTECSSGD